MKMSREQLGFGFLAAYCLVAVAGCSGHPVGNSNVNSSNLASCGDGLQGGIEQCDGNDLGGNSCQTIGYSDGFLDCQADCMFDVSDCFVIHPCGNGVLDPQMEECDGLLLNDQTCEDLGFDSGTLACDVGCAYNTSGCAYAFCGDGNVDASELCDDGNNINGDGCSSTCQDETILLCGNGFVDIGEECDDGDQVDWDGCTDCSISEFQINENTIGGQWHPRGAIDSSGRLTSVWTENVSDGTSDVYVRQYDATGAPLWGAFRLNTSMADDQWRPRVVALPSGDVATIWQSGGWQGGGIRMQRIDASGALLGSEGIVSIDTVPACCPNMTRDASGNIAVVWSAYGSGFDMDVYVRLYDASGAAQGPTTLVNSYQSGLQSWPDVAMNASGDFVVVWERDSSVNSPYPVGNRVLAQRYQADGSPVGGEIDVSAPASFQFLPHVALGDDGRFVVLWRYRDPQVMGGRSCNYYRVFASDGSALTSEVLLQGCAVGSYYETPTVVPEPGGNFLLAWSKTDGGVSAIYTARIGSNSILGFATQINAVTVGWPQAPTLSRVDDGRYAVLWNETQGMDGDGWGCFAQRYSALGDPRGLLPW